MNTEEEQKNSDTPETDALAVTCYSESGIEDSYGFLAVPIEGCRKLERERDEALEWRHIKVTKNGETHCLGSLIELLERERDEAKKELHKIYIEFDKLFYSAELIRIERDKALEELVGFKNYTK